jgi:hypothetical protein
VSDSDQHRPPFWYDALELAGIWLFLGHLPLLFVSVPLGIAALMLAAVFYLSGRTLSRRWARRELHRIEVLRRVKEAEQGLESARQEEGITRQPSRFQS